jgi:uncharacterized protein
MTIGYVGLFTLAFKTGFFGKMTKYISSVGKMALSNYLIQSFICAFIFYGFGLGLYGSLTRFGLVPIILLLWVFQLYASKYWLKHFTQGPIEWVWRTLSTFSIQTIRRKSES